MISNQEIVEKWFEAFNDQNLEKLLSLYHPEATHYSPKLKVFKPSTNGLICGKAELKAWWKDAFERLPGLHYEIVYLIFNDEKVFMDYIRHNEGEEDLRVGEVLVFNHGLIISSRVFHS
jgi:hypothetical protein